MLRLAAAPRDAIETVNYNIDGAKPTPSAAQLADAVRARIPDAAIDFQPDPTIQAVFDKSVHAVDDSRARREWGWTPSYEQGAMVEDFLAELAQHPERYR